MLPTMAVVAPEMDYVAEHVSLGGTDNWKAFDYIYGTDDGPYLDGLPERTILDGVTAPQYTPARPLSFTITDLQVTWNTSTWTYVSIELATYEDGSHWHIGIWERFYGEYGERETVYELAYYDAPTGTNEIVCFVRVLPGVSDARPQITANYWTQNAVDGEPYTMCSVTFDVANDFFDYSYSFGIHEPFKVRVKTEYAAANYFKTVGDYNPFSPGYAEGMEDGYDVGYLTAKDEYYDKGYADGEYDKFKDFRDLYKEAGGLNDYLTVDDVSVITRYFRDKGWQECADQGALTAKLIYTTLEAPINVILGGLDFTLFGINLAETFFAILTIVIVYAVLRVVLNIISIVT